MLKVSVIIPVYNVEKYLPACLDSVLNQTLRDLEVICVDDCSPDNCGRILDEYAAMDQRVKVIHLPENRRQGYARNRGIERAAGKYLYFLDSDDMIRLNALEELYAQAEAEALDAIFFDSTTVYESEEIRRVYTPPFQRRKGIYEDRVYTGSDLFDAFVRQDEYTCYPQRIFWRQELILKEDIRYPEGVEHEDEFFAFAGLLIASRVRYVPRDYFILRVRPNSVMTSPVRPRNFHGYLMNYYLMNQFVASRRIDTYASERNIARMYERSATQYGQLKDSYDLWDSFTTDKERIILQCFISCLQAKVYYEEILEHVLNEIYRYKAVYLYGAGLVGSRFCNKLIMRSDIRIKGFLVTSKAKAPDVLLGFPVQAFNEVIIQEDELVIVTVAARFLPEIAPTLDAAGCHWIHYR